MKDNTFSTNTRKAYLDVARTVAIICVVLNHAVNHSYEYSFAEFWRTPLITSIVCAAIEKISRMGVPIFLMITGALILNKDFSSKEKIVLFYKKNYLPLFVATEIWLFIMFWYRAAPTLTADHSIGMCFFKLISCLETTLFINQDTMENMWYMAMILCVYPLLPAVSILLDKLPLQSMMIPGGMLLLGGFVFPIVNDYLRECGAAYQVNFALHPEYVFSKYLVLIVAGYFIDKGILAEKEKRRLIIAFVFIFPLTVIFQLIGFSMPFEDINLSHDYNSLLTIICSVILFELIRRRVWEYSFGFCTNISRSAFGIYFVHICIIWGEVEYFGDIMLRCFGHIGTLFILAVSSFVGSVLIIRAMYRWNFARKYLFVLK